MYLLIEKGFQEQQSRVCPCCFQREDITEDKIQRLRERSVSAYDTAAVGRLQIQEVRLPSPPSRPVWGVQINRCFQHWVLRSVPTSLVTTDVNPLSPAGRRDAARGGKLPASVPQRDAAGQQRGVHEGEGERSSRGQWTFSEYSHTLVGGWVQLLGPG